MYDYISGSVVELSPTELILDNQGIGYKALISLQTYSSLQGSSSAKVYIYHLVREDDEQFYGFFNKEERRIFLHLISVSGIGPNTARMMLSSLSSEEVTTSILTGDVNKIKSVKGIGLKTAQRAIIELKDKVGKSDIDTSTLISAQSSHQEEATSALVMLGFSKSAIEKVLSSILKKSPNLTLEELIKNALKAL